jgi:hypothetical protein
VGRRIHPMEVLMQNVSGSKAILVKDITYYIGSFPVEVAEGTEIRVNAQQGSRLSAKFAWT